jgi:hypothetical protein
VVRVHPQEISVRSLFSSSPAFSYLGVLRKEDNSFVLLGSYRLTPVVRYFMSTWCFLLLVCAAISICLILYFVAHQDWRSSAVSALVLVMSLLFLVATHYVAEFYRFVNRPYRNKLCQMLEETTAANASVEEQG